MSSDIELFKIVDAQLAEQKKSEDKIKSFIENDIINLVKSQLNKKSKKEKLLESLLSKIENELEKLSQEEDIDIMKLTKIYEVIARIELESDSSILENTLGLLKQPMVQNNVNSNVPTNNGVINNNNPSLTFNPQKSIQDVTPEEISVLKKLIIQAQDSKISNPIDSEIIEVKDSQ
jgi:hypothetical protein